MFAELKRYKNKKQFKNKKDMAREAGNYKATTFLGIGKDGSFYATSKEPREGYVEYTSNEGNLSYRKNYSGTEFGKITNLAIEEKEFNKGKVKFLAITVENPESKDIVQIPLETIGGGITDVVKKFTALLIGIDFSRDLTISSNRKKNERGYIDRVLFVNYVNDGVMEEQGLKFSLKFGKEGDVPMFEMKKGRDGTIKYDYEAQDDYMYAKLVEQLERFEKEKVSVPFIPTEETPAKEAKEAKEAEKAEEAKPIETAKSKPAKATEAKVGVEEDDDLPF